MITAYYYPPSVLGLSEYAPGYFKFDPSIIAPTDDPHAASCFVLPTDIRHATDAQIFALPYLRLNEARHVFFSLSEFPDRALPVNASAFRTDHNTCLRRAGNTYARAWGWASEDLEKYVPIPDGDVFSDSKGFRFDVHAQLWASSPMTDEAVESCKRAGLRVHDRRNREFYGHLETRNDPQLEPLRRTFLESMQASKLVLVPRSRPAVNRYRFFEAMSMGRVPVLLCDDCMLSCDDKIDYARCAIRIEEFRARDTGYILRDWLHDHTLAEIISMGAYGRAAWERYLNPQKWESVWAELTVEHLVNIVARS